MEMARNCNQVPVERRKGRTLYVYDPVFASQKKDSRTISALDAKLAAMQSLIYGTTRAKRSASKWC